MNTIAFIESNTTGTGRLLARKALQRGFQVLFIASEPNRYPWLGEEMVHPVILDTHDRDRVLGHLRLVSGLTGILSSSEYFLETAAYVAQNLGLPTAKLDSIERCRDKARLAVVLGNAGVRIPHSIAVGDMAEAEAGLADCDFPLVVKPANGSGSIGVKLCRNRESCLEHLTLLLSRNTNERGQRVDPKILIQEFVDGPEYSVETFGDGHKYEILGITRKYLGDPPFFLEIGHDFPAALDPESHRSIVTEVERALDAVGLTFGPSHTEVRMCGGQPVIIEINPRLAGGMIPVLIETARGFDPLDFLLDLYTGQKVSTCKNNGRAASIRFLVPKSSGTLRTTAAGPALADLPGLVQWQFTRKSGEWIECQGDFRDRIGFVITSGDDDDESGRRADKALAEIPIVLDPLSEPLRAGSADTGRLKKVLHPEALRIVRTPPPRVQRIQELEQLATIDEAHLLMLVDRGLLARDKAKLLLTEIRRLRDEGFGSLCDQVAPRGTYLLYEDYLIQRLGSEVAGSVHLGRSRNDINATTHLLDLRAYHQAVCHDLWQLRSTLLQGAVRHRSLAMPIYSQYQPGLPGTFAFYIQGIEEVLARDYQALRQLSAGLDCCPLGAGAGCGTSVPIDPSLCARLLGFESHCTNALDAVASRDTALHFLASLAICGTHLSRLAEDCQLWTTLEFGFFELPDDLAGGSSMMPQKKNPYLIEIVKGKCTRLPSRLAGALASTARVPFGNSLQVGTEAQTELKTAATELQEAASLIRLIVAHLQPRPDNMARAAERGLVLAAPVAESLVLSAGLPFRQVHHCVGETIAEALASGDEAQAALLALLPDGVGFEGDLMAWADRLQYGGGPGAVDHAMGAAEQRARADAEWLRARSDAYLAAERHRAQRVAHLLA